MKAKLIVNNPDSAIKLTPQQAADIGIKDITADQQRGDMETVGPWNIPKSYKAVSMAANYSGGVITRKTKAVFFGPRTLSNPEQSGYCLEGTVSINGKNYTAFTSSQLFEVNGHLIDVAIVHARMDLKDPTDRN